MKEKANWRSTKTILFSGDNTSDMIRIAATTLAGKRKILVADLSEKESLFHSVLGDVDCTTVLYRLICYSKSRRYIKDHWMEYDVLLLFTNENVSMLSDLSIPVDCMYIGIGLGKGSLCTLGHIIDKGLPVIHKNFYIVLRETEEQADKYHVKTNIKTILSQKKEPDEMFYIPVSEKDTRACLRLDYGTVDEDSLSQNMEMLLKRIKEMVN